MGDSLENLRVLFVGALRPFLTTTARRDAFVALGVPLEALDTTPFVRSGRGWLDSLTHWTSLTPGVFALNRALLEAARRFQPNTVWIERGTCVFPRTLRALRRLGGMALVYHNTDDWRSTTPWHRLHWRLLLRGLPYYDLHITSNLHNVREFRQHGFRRVHHMELAANEAIPQPAPPSDDERRVLGGPVGFIGHWEPATERTLAHLVRSGIPLKIYGGGWEKATGPELRDAIQDRYVWGEEYGRAIVSFDVNLGIVSKWNRNHTASRTFQIPALGAFLLHERNGLVKTYFREDAEAAFFGSDEELVRKCRYFLDHPDERRRIAEAGRRRCHGSGYFEADRVREALPALEDVVRACA